MVFIYRFYCIHYLHPGTVLSLINAPGALAQKGGAFIKKLTFIHKINVYGGAFIPYSQVRDNGGAFIRGGAYIRDTTVC